MQSTPTRLSTSLASFMNTQWFDLIEVDAENEIHTLSIAYLGVQHSIEVPPSVSIQTRNLSTTRYLLLSHGDTRQSFENLAILIGLVWEHSTTKIDVRVLLGRRIRIPVFMTSLWSVRNSCATASDSHMYVELYAYIMMQHHCCEPNKNKIHHSKPSQKIGVKEQIDNP